MKKHIVVTLLLLLLIPLTALSRPRSVEEAMAAISGARHVRGKVAKTSLAYAAPDSLNADNALLYVFNHGTDGGFTIVAGDDRVEPVLGYTDKGSFDLTAAPPALRWWIKQYARQMQLLSGAPESGNVTFAETARPTIQPLVQTKWNQSAPYNDLCPVKNGSRSVTGCVATAFAQVIAYHKHFKPNASVGVVTSEFDGTKFDFGNATFDWNSMLNVYKKGQYTTTQGQAVANLMLACGVSVNMQYTPQESGAITDFYVPHALTEYFGYDKGVRVMERECTYTADWTEAIYKELAASRPVIYSGSGDGGGHCFVCDGYQSQSNIDYFHFNWGWAGAGDGWYRLAGLDPITLGIGGGTGGGYSYGQSIVVGIQPPVSDSGYNRYVRGIVDPQYGSPMQNNRYLNLAVHTYSLYPKALNYNLGYKISGNSPANASMTPILASSNETFSVDGCKATGHLGYNVAAFAVDLNNLNLPKGSYRLTPMLRIQDEDWKPLTQTVDKFACVDLTVQGPGQYSANFQQFINRNQLQAQIIAPENASVNPGDSIKLDIVLENKAPWDFESEIFLVAFNKEGDINSVNNNLFYTSAKFIIAGNDTHRATITAGIPSEMQLGEYRFAIFQPQLVGYNNGFVYDYERISEPIAWTAGNSQATELETKFISSDFYENEPLNIQIANGTTKDFQKDIYLAVIRNVGGSYNGYYYKLGQLQLGAGKTLNTDLTFNSNPFFVSGKYIMYFVYINGNEVVEIPGTFEVNFHSYDAATGLHMGLGADGYSAVISKASTPVCFDGSHFRLPKSFNVAIPTSWNNDPVYTTFTLPVKEMRPDAFKKCSVTDIHIPNGFEAPVKLEAATNTKRFWLEGSNINVSNAQAFPKGLNGMNIFVPSGAYEKYSSALKAVNIAPADTLAAHIFETASVYRLQALSNDTPQVGNSYPLAVITDTPTPFHYYPDVEVVCTEPDKATVEIDSNPWDRNVGIKVNVTPLQPGEITLRITPRQYGASASELTINVPASGVVETKSISPDLFENEPFNIQITNGTSKDFNNDLYLAVFRNIGGKNEGYYYKLGTLQLGAGKTLDTDLKFSTDPFLASGKYTLYFVYVNGNEVIEIPGSFEVNFHSYDAATGLHMGLGTDGYSVVISKATAPVCFDGSHFRLPSSYTATIPTSWNDGPVCSTLSLPVKEMRPDAFKECAVYDIHIPNGFEAPVKLDVATNTKRFWLEGSNINVSNAQSFPKGLNGMNIFVPSGAYEKYSSALKAVNIAPADTLATHMFETASVYRLQALSNDTPQVGNSYPLAVVTDTPTPFHYYPDVEVVCTDPGKATVEIDSNPWDRNVGIKVNVTPHQYGEITLRITPRQYGASASELTINVPDPGVVETKSISSDIYENQPLEIKLFNNTSKDFSENLYLHVTRKFDGKEYGYDYNLGKPTVKAGKTFTTNMTLPSDPFLALGKYTMSIVYHKSDAVVEIPGTFEVNFHSYDAATGLHMALGAGGYSAVISKVNTPVCFDDFRFRLPTSFTASIPIAWNDGPVITTIALPVKEMLPEAFRYCPARDLHIPDGFEAPVKLGMSVITKRFWLEGSNINVSNAQAFPNGLKGVSIFVPAGAYEKYCSALNVANIASADILEVQVFETASVYRLQALSNDTPQVGNSYPLAVVADTPTPFHYYPDVEVVCTEPGKATVEIDTNPWDRNVGIKVNVTPRQYGDVTLRVTPRQYGATASDFTLSIPDPSGLDLINVSGETEIYTINGQRIYGTPTPGLYIIRSNGIVRKTWLK